jgi:uncharacterized iron-regulated membrane protein
LPIASASHANFTIPPEIDLAVNQLKSTLPGWRTLTVEFSKEPAASPATYRITDAGRGRPDRVHSYSWDAQDQRLTEIPAKPLPWRQFMRWLHTGEIGGVVGQTIALLACAAACVLVWTGVALSLRRFNRRKHSHAP